MAADRSSWRWRDVALLAAVVVAIVALHGVGAYFTIGPGQ